MNKKYFFHLDMMDVTIYKALALFASFITIVSSQTQDEVRLVGADSIREGRVEIYHDGQWGTVCDDYWSPKDATVVCRQLGLGNSGEDVDDAAFGEGTGPIWLSEAGCSGYENNLQECPSLRWNTSACRHYDDAGVRCTDELVRLVGDQNISEGRVEVFRDGEWGTVCDAFWDDLDAIVVCRQLGLGNDGVAVLSAAFGEGSGPIWQSNVGCTGFDYYLHLCRQNTWIAEDCGHHNDAGVRCGNLVRLADGRSATEGRVEILHNGTWGTVCNNSWDESDATVVCRQLGLGFTGEAVSGSMFGEGDGTIWLADVQCTGYENNLRLCRSSGWGYNDCQHHQDAAVRCTGLDSSSPELDGAGATIPSPAAKQSNAFLYVILGLLIVLVIALVVVVVIQRIKLKRVAGYATTPKEPSGL